MIKKKRQFIILLLLIFTSITIVDYSLFINNPRGINKVLENEQMIHEELKISSLIEYWNTSWDNGAWEEANGIAVEELTGNIYVAGNNGSSGDGDVLLIKYNNNGEQLWNVTWDSGVPDFINDVALDSNGNVYVTGVCGDLPVEKDVLLVKFNSSGGYQWNRTYDRTGVSDGASALKIDNEDRIYILGWAFPSDEAILLLQYNITGHFQWESIFDGIEIQSGADLVLDSMNNIYVVGTNGTVAASNDLLVVKFNSTGGHIWNRTWGEYGNTDQGFGIALDSNNNVYATGFTTSYGANDYDFIIVKYDTNGFWKWNDTWGYDIHDEARCIATDSQDNIYICGFSLFSNVSILQYNTSGGLVWSKTWANNSIYRYWWEDMTFDSIDNLYITGRNNTGGADYDVFTAKLSVDFPAVFSLTADCGVIDDDGIFNLNWTQAPRAVNYSIYRYNSYISEINDTLTLITNQTQALSFPLSGYTNGTYYFKGVAFNNFGNNTSNCINVTVAIPPSESTEPPGSFSLTVDCGAVDDDGIFNLNWTQAPRAVNYSIYRYNSYISEINNTLTLIANQTQALSFPLSGYTNGTYYFKGVAFNNFGNSTSNCINVTVAIPSTESTEPPGSFTLSSNAGNPDDNGDFTLTWTSSNGANNYSIYQYSNYISTINNSLTLLEAEINALSLVLTGYLNGSYHFIVVASNNYGNTTSNDLQIDVEIPPEDEENEQGIPGYNLMVVIIGFAAIVSILIYRRLKLK